MSLATFYKAVMTNCVLLNLLLPKHHKNLQNTTELIAENDYRRNKFNDALHKNVKYFRNLRFTLTNLPLISDSVFPPKVNGLVHFLQTPCSDRFGPYRIRRVIVVPYDPQSCANSSPERKTIEDVMTIVPIIFVNVSERLASIACFSCDGGIVYKWNGDTAKYQTTLENLPTEFIIPLKKLVEFWAKLNSN